VIFPSETTGGNKRRAIRRVGKNAQLTQTPFGDCISMNPGGRWRHPWWVTPRWLPAQQRWVAFIKPGFVNGNAPVYRTTIKGAKSVEQDFGINPLTGRPFFSDDVFSKPKSQTYDVTIDVPITAAPAIALGFRSIGFDGDGDVPQFFLDRGVQPPVPLNKDGSQNVTDTAPKPGMRLLRACDLVLHQPRLALSSSITLAPGPATGISNVTQTLTLRSVDPADRLKVFATSKFSPLAEIAEGFDPLAGDYEEPTWDEVLIATVFLLSPPNATPGSDPDGTWTPYVRHNLFWNLHYGTPEFRVLDTDPGIPFIPPLAGGAAQIIINFLTASLNDATQQALNILTAHSMSGTFWTPTGAGTSAVFPVDESSEDTTGLEKSRRLQRRRIAAADAMKTSKLDPSYPFRGQPFPVSFLIP